MKFLEEESLICFNLCSLCLKQAKEIISFREKLCTSRADQWTSNKTIWWESLRSRFWSIPFFYVTSHMTVLQAGNGVRFPCAVKCKVTLQLWWQTGKAFVHCSSPLRVPSIRKVASYTVGGISIISERYFSFTLTLPCSQILWISILEDHRLLKKFQCGRPLHW